MWFGFIVKWMDCWANRVVEYSSWSMTLRSTRPWTCTTNRISLNWPEISLLNLKLLRGSKTRDLSTILPNEDVLEKVRLLLIFYVLPCNQLPPRLKMQIETFEASSHQKYQRLKWMKFKQSLQTLSRPINFLFSLNWLLALAKT